MKILFEQEIIPYLTEYLILSDGITLKEGKEILTEAKEKSKSSLVNLYRDYKERIKKLDKLQAEKIKAAGNNKEEITKIEKAISNLKKKAYVSFMVSKKAIIGKYSSAKNAVKTAIYKTGKSGKGLSMAGKFGNLTKLAKTGVIGAGVATGLAGYAAYRAKKNRDRYLPSKEVINNANQSTN